MPDFPVAIRPESDYTNGMFFLKNRLAVMALLLWTAPWTGVLKAQDTPIKVSTKMLNDGSTMTTVLDQNKHSSEEIIADIKGKVIKKTVHTLDDRNLPLSAVHYGPKGEVRYQEAFKKDQYDRVIESTLTSATGQPLGRRVFVYDAKGRPTVTDYDAAGALLAKREPANPTTSRGRPDKPKSR